MTNVLKQIKFDTHPFVMSPYSRDFLLISIKITLDFT